MEPQDLPLAFPILGPQGPARWEGQGASAAEHQLSSVLVLGLCLLSLQCVPVVLFVKTPVSFLKGLQAALGAAWKVTSL